MDKTKKQFSVQKRPTTKNNKFKFYVQFRDENGKYGTAVSSGQTSRSAAEAWAAEQLMNKNIPTKRGLTLNKYSENWWVWDKRDYIKGKLLRGKAILKSTNLG